MVSKNTRGVAGVKISRGWCLLRLPLHAAVPAEYRGKCLGLNIKADAAGIVQAEAIAKMYTADILRGDVDVYRYLPETKTREKRDTRLSTVLTRYIDAKQCSERTKKLDLIAASKVVSVIGDKDAASVTRGDVALVCSSIVYIRPHGQRVLLNLCRAAWEKVGITPNPWVGASRSVPRQQRRAPKPFTTQEQRAIVAAFESDRITRSDGKTYPNPYRWYSPLVRFLLSTGLRTGEARALQWSSISPDCLSVGIVDSLDGDNKPKGRTKTENSRRMLVLNEEARSVLIALKGDTDRLGLVFPAPEGGYICQSNFVRRAWKECLHVACVEYRPPYNCRKTALTNWVQRGVPLNAVAALGGTSLEMLSRHYVGHTDALKIPEGRMQD